MALGGVLAELLTDKYLSRALGNRLVALQRRERLTAEWLAAYF